LYKKSFALDATFPPPAACSQREGLPSPWREFKFTLHQVQQAIEPQVPLQQVLSSWNQIAQALAENSRDRSPQVMNSSLKFATACNRFDPPALDKTFNLCGEAALENSSQLATLVQNIGLLLHLH
jgi:hypothetical protein